ncbi:MAG: D-glycero-beta-D-manno-heptose 1,7-bisphosphate 7-phosphatase [Nanoarchaeota archaeon]|nr:D-glycero-beta-D-manno-heptose 1,7-bisphosphate 7-phosphatase [Nanoarchaeota archaeon]
MKAVFLDRDGTINVDHNYVSKIDKFEFLPGAISGMRRFSELGYGLVIITNQSGIGRGLYTEEDYKTLMEHMKQMLRKEGIELLGEYHCSHLPEIKCKCRKPGTDLIHQAMKDNNITAEGSFMIGDKTTDILAGKNAGLKTILVMTGKAGKDKTYTAAPDIVALDLEDAAAKISIINHKS